MAEGASLVLLPALALPTTTSSFRSSYQSTFDSLLPKLLPQDKQSTTRLDIGLILSPSYPVSTNTSRSAVFPAIQNLLKQTYSLVCSVAATRKIDLDFPGGIDVRILIFEPRSEQLPQKLVGKQVLSGPIVDLDTFVLSDRTYKTIYSVEGEDGEGLLKQFLTTWGSKQKEEPPPIVRLPSGPAIIHPEASSETSRVEDGPIASHKSVAVGGTFDHLHIGHKLLLTATLLAAHPTPDASRFITVGITGDELLVNKKYGTHVESWDVRQQRTAEFVDTILAFYPRKPSPDINGSGLTTTECIDEPGPNGKVVRVTYHHPHSNGGDPDIVVNYTRISDPFGPTITDPSISALVVSAETRAGGKAVNDRRKEKNWKELEVFEVDVLDAGVGLEAEGDGQEKQKESFESKISSTEIRRRLQEKEHQEGR